ncbi:MAG TPA: nitroreductase family protein [Acidimicrobiia bacterium]|nr:nitroreductase family protein [Acidimicrobiia bacterium]
MPHPTVPHRALDIPEGEETATARRILSEMDQRRSVREFSSRPVPREMIEAAVAAASTAPSGAHKQPWTFVITQDADVKRAVRNAAEAEERLNYEGGRLPQHWLEDLEPLGTSWEKPFLEVAPWLVVVFEQRYGVGEGGQRLHHYYVKESVGIACGMFIDAVHRMGLVTLTHTPSPMAFLRTLLGRPESERPFILFPVGYPADGCRVPDLTRKPLDHVMVEVGREDIDGFDRPDS